MISKLLRFTLPEQVGLSPEQVDYLPLLSKIAEDRIHPQIYHYLKKQGRFLMIPVFFQEALAAGYYDSLYKNIFIKAETDRLLEMFGQAGVRVIPLKGPLFAEKYYGSQGARGTTDIDLLIRREQMDEAAGLVKENGYQEEASEIAGHFHLGFYKHLPGSPYPLSVELHWNLLREDTSGLDPEEFWQHSEGYRESAAVRMLSDYHTFYFILLHGWRHNMDSSKYYFDIIQMVHFMKDSLDFGRLMADGNRHQTRKRLIRTLAAVYRAYPELRFLKEPPADIAKRLRRPEMKERSRWGVYADFLDYSLFSYDHITHSLKGVRDIIAVKSPRKKEKK